MRSLPLWLIVPSSAFIVGNAYIRPSGDLVRIEQMKVASLAGQSALAVAHGDQRVADVVSIQNAAEATQLAVIIPTTSMMIEAAVSGGISCANRHDQLNCARFHAFKPGAQQKMSSLLQSYSSSSQGFTQIASVANRIILGNTTSRLEQGLPAGATLQVDHPSARGNLWQGDVTNLACKNALDRAKDSAMAEAPFPSRMESRVSRLATGLLPQLAKALCGLDDQSGPLTLPQVAEVREKVAKDIEGLKALYACQRGYAEHLVNACPSAEELQANPGSLSEAAWRGRRSEESEDETGSAALFTRRELVFSSDVEKCLHPICKEVTAPGSVSRISDLGVRVSGRARRWTCTIDEASCQQKKLEERTAEFLNGVGIPTSPIARGGPGGNGTGPVAPTDDDVFTTFAEATKPLTKFEQIFPNDAAVIRSFRRGGSILPKNSVHHATAGARWYFSDGEGAVAGCAGVPRAEHPLHPGCWRAAHSLGERFSSR